MCFSQITIILSFLTFFVHLSFIQEDIDLIKKQQIHNITDKIDKIARDIQNHTSLDEKYEILRNIEKKLQNAAQHLGSRGKNHVELIMQGIKLKVFNSSKEPKKNNYDEIYEEKASSLDKDQSVNEENIDILATKINSLIENKLEGLKKAHSKHTILEKIKEKVLESVNEKQKKIHTSDGDNKIDSNYTRRFSVRDSYTIDKSNSDDDRKGIVNKLQEDLRIVGNNTFQSDPMCEEITDRICSQIKRMNSLKCLYDDIIVPLDSLCNGLFDCPDKSDEKYCGSRAMERLQYSNWVMTNIRSNQGNNNCIGIDDSKKVLSKKNELIKNILQMQEEFREKYKNSFHSDNLILKRDTNEEIVKVKANEITLTIRSFALKLESALCSDTSDDFQTRRKTDSLDNDLEQNLPKQTSWPPKQCKCNTKHCTNCTDVCKRICWQQNSLTLWNCESIHGTDTVSLNSLCDGKLDCLDESDENDCMKGNGYEKFEAHEMYRTILKMLKLKASKESLPTKNNLLSLWNLISKLHRLTTKYIPDTTAIKKLRNRCYSSLKTIYLDKLLQSYTFNESEEAYLFLISVNENLGAALKRSNTGNSKIIADGCYCRNGQCGTKICSKVCVKACRLEPQFMRYQCGEDSSMTVAIDGICNNKSDCTNGIDEFNCKKDEICRPHHLILLRHNLKEIGENLKGTALGELLISWKTKVISTLKVAEKNRRPRPTILRNIVKDILRDLLVTYGTVEDYRRSNTDYALPEFLIIAQIIMETLKSCGK